MCRLHGECYAASEEPHRWRRLNERKPISWLRLDGCAIMRVDIAQGKAYAALSMGMSSRMLRDRLGGRPTAGCAAERPGAARQMP